MAIIPLTVFYFFQLLCLLEPTFNDKRHLMKRGVENTTNLILQNFAQCEIRAKLSMRNRAGTLATSEMLRVLQRLQ